MKITPLFFIFIAAATIITSHYWYISEKKKMVGTDLQNPLTDTEQIQRHSISDTSFSEDYRESISSDADYVMLQDSDYVMLQNDNPNNYVDPLSTNSQHAQYLYEYKQLMSDFSIIEGAEKIHVMQKLWRLSPKVGVDEEFLTLLQIASYDPDARIEQLASKILNDLQRFSSGAVQREQQLVSQIMEIDAVQHNIQSLPADGAPQLSEEEVDNEATSSMSVEASMQRSEKIDQLKESAINSDNTATKEFALSSLLQIDQNAAQDVIQYQLLNSNNTNERIKAIEILRSSIGDFDNDKIRQILETVTNDYDIVVAESAVATLGVLDDYIELQRNPQSTPWENVESYENNSVADD